MDKKGLTISFVIEAESPNYGEGEGNVTTLKKMTRGSGESHSYIARQAIRYNIVQQMGEDNTPLHADKKVIQFHPDATVKDHPEIDLFGRFTTSGDGIKTRSAVARLSNAISLESFQGDIDFLNNKGLFDRYSSVDDYEGKVELSGNNILQSEIHHSYYAYTIAIDLDQIGIDRNEGVEIEAEEKERRVQLLIKTIKFLYRDIRARRLNLTPIFAIGGVYDIKNPFFDNRIKVKRNRLNTRTLKSILQFDPHIAENTKCGLFEGIFDNDKEIYTDLNAVSMGEFFQHIHNEITSYYLKSGVK